jgi:hemolysin activation/secretion protein
MEETPAFKIQQLAIIGDALHLFHHTIGQGINKTGLQYTSDKLGSYRLSTNASYSNGANRSDGVLLGAQGINRLMSAIQNQLIASGYTTTRILASPQDLSRGQLQLNLIVGRIGQIKLETEAGQIGAERIHLLNALPMSSGDILNLRDIEQGLENLKRIPTAESDIKIAPGASPNSSDLIIHYQQKKIPLRFNFSLDDSGSSSTGVYQGSATISLDNLLQMSDILYLSYGSDVAGYKDTPTIIDGIATDKKQKGQSNNWGLHYSIPYGYWQLSFNAGGYRYDQAVAGLNQTYRYSGNSRTQDITLSRLLYRDNKRKSSLSIKGWSRFSDNYIDDAELTVQRRKSAGWELRLTHRHYLGQGTLDASIAYKHGTGARNALPQTIEDTDTGKTIDRSRVRLFSANLNYSTPFTLWDTTPMVYTGSLNAQWNKEPLSPQDFISIGGRNTVRGFDGQTTLSSERGWYTRHEIFYPYTQQHGIYLGVDGGHVSGPNARWLLGQTLIGSYIGLRGQFKLWTTALQYDAFAGQAIQKPEQFRTARTTYGFNIHYTF